MDHRALTLPTRTWSGSSMLQGIGTMTSSAIVNMELPENEQDLASMVQVGHWGL